MMRWIWLPLLLLLAVAGWGWVQATTAVTPPATVELQIPKGASSVKIAAMLGKAGVIRSPLAFRLLARWRGDAGLLQSGYYRFEQAATPGQILDRLRRGDVMRFSLTVPEGLRTDEVLALLAERSGIELAVWRKALAARVQGEAEGRLLPETYSYTKPLQPGQLIGEMVDAQQRLLDKLAKSPEQAVRLRIIASIVEKETSLQRERSLVSAVIRNRLQKGMPLQMDPTVIYGLYRTQGGFSGNLHKSDLQHDTPWNSYTRTGLPPTPICNPGAASLQAAAAPADVDYLYFVADGSGGHAFAATLAEHEANVKRWVALEKKRAEQGSGQP